MNNPQRPLGSAEVGFATGNGRKGGIWKRFFVSLRSLGMTERSTRNDTEEDAQNATEEVTQDATEGDDLRMTQERCRERIT